MKQWPPVYDASYQPEPDSQYWFAEIETMDPEQREQTIILPKLQQQLKYAYEHSGLYRKKRYAVLQLIYRRKSQGHGIRPGQGF